MFPHNNVQYIQIQDSSLVTESNWFFEMLAGHPIDIPYPKKEFEHVVCPSWTRRQLSRSLS